MCKSTGRLRYFSLLEVFFENKTDDYIKKNQSLPDDLLRSCEMKNIFSEQGTLVMPLTNHHDLDVNNASINLIHKHQEKYSRVYRILMQVSFNALRL